MNFPNTALSPFFDTLVKISASRPNPNGQAPLDLSFSVKACVMPATDAEPIVAEVSVQSTRPRFTVLLAASGSPAWIEAAIGSRPQIGDQIELANGLQTSVRKVSPVVDAWYELEVEA